MKCEKCGKNEATTFYKETINGQTREMHLCADCAREMNLGGAFQNAFAGMASGMAGAFAGFDQLFSDPFHSMLGGGLGTLWNEMMGLPAGGARPGTERKCPTCGTTESELRRTGRAGCPDCYHTFEDILNPYIRRVHGADAHIGSAPQSAAPETPQADPVAELRAKLQEAVQSENYEEAARLRDEIHRLEGGGK